MLDRLISVVRNTPWTAAGILLFGVLVITLALREVTIRNVESNPDVQQRRVVEDALTTIESRFQMLQERVHARAEALATDSVIIRGLARRHQSGERHSSLVRRVLELPLDERTAVEIYTSDLDLLSWNGHRMPFGEAPQSETFLERPQASIVADGSVRRALVVWWPVTADGETVGAVRVVRTIRYQPLVKNRYIQGFSLRERWEERTGESIRLHWSGSSEYLEGPHRTLEGPHDVLGTVTVVPPSAEQLVQRTASQYDDLLAGWITLLLGWIVGFVGTWYFRLAGRPGTGRLPKARHAAAGRFAILAGLWVAVRYALLAIDVPSRWVKHLDSLSALFDPTRFASTAGGGLFRSIGDLLLTGGWALVLAVGLLHLGLLFRIPASSTRGLFDQIQKHSSRRPSSSRFFGTVLTVVGLGLASTFALAFVVRRAVLDSTLDFFSRTGLLPDPLVFIVLSALVMLVLALLLLGTASAWIGLRIGLRYAPTWPRGLVPSSVVLLFAAVMAALYLSTDAQALVPFPYPLAVTGIIGIAAVYGMIGRDGGAEILTVRGLLLSLFVITLLFYPLLYAGMDAQRRERMQEAAQSFEEGYDPRVLYSMQQILRASDEELGPPLSTDDGQTDPAVDSVATRLVRRSLLASLTTYDVSLTLFSSEGRPRRRYGADGRQPLPPSVRRTDRQVFAILQQTYTRQLSPGPVVDRLTGDRGIIRSGERFQYAGLLRLGEPNGQAWILLRAEPRSLLPGTGSGVPRVLLPDGSFSTLYAELSLAEFRDGTLARSYGDSFGRTRLPTLYASALRHQSTLWRSETVQGREYLTYYYRPPDDQASTVAVRIPSILAFDHLYYLLRLTVAGLGVGLLIYLLGLLWRYRRGLVPAERVRFRNKVLNAFLVVGVVSMVAVGVVGVQVVTSENERIVERRLRDHLGRVEETLTLEARPGEPLWQVAERMDVDSLAARVGLDLRMYNERELVATSRPRLVRDGLVEERLPGTVYHDLYNEAYRFIAANASIGQFRYRVGYQALVDERGDPRLVVGVPTLAQQEQMAEEQARTLAYLFGALLVLVVVVMLTAVVLANALAQPIARLRKGLEAVGKGRFARALPVDTRDEIGDLVRTFNEMRAQLAESRRKLAQQEREIAWREMARQVAHEIKNPLTPMKLSIQHLQRAFKQREHTNDTSSEFADLFTRITSTLIEQIDSLERIADEFSTFARLPTRVLETLDLNEVIEEAARLMEQESDVRCIELELDPDPLVVEVDREELRRTYINLLKNALQALPDDDDGHITVTTSRVTGPDGPMVESRVIDTGTGIPVEVQDKIFEPNFSTKTSGTGLGLAIVQKTVDDLGGTVGFETAEGEGTTFWIRLPLTETDARN